MAEVDKTINLDCIFWLCSFGCNHTEYGLGLCVDSFVCLF